MSCDFQTGRVNPVSLKILDQLSIKCPHCDENGTFTWVIGTVVPRTDGDIEYSFWICPNLKCRGVVHIINNQGGQILDHYPKRVPKLDRSVPEQVQLDMVEAYKSYDAGAWRGSASMTRRALQNSLMEKGATKEKLREQIDELFDKDIITKDIRNWAHEIRLTGNIGAHPDKDGLKDVTQAEAKQLLDFMEQYLNYVYVMPARVDEKRKAKDQPKQPVPRDIREKSTVPTKSF